MLLWIASQQQEYVSDTICLAVYYASDVVETVDCHTEIFDLSYMGANSFMWNGPSAADDQPIAIS